MDLHYLELFNTIAQYESYKKASDVLHISQPALSVQIKKLEGQIGLKLFDKIGNKVHLSENGLMLYDYTKKIFGILEDLNQNISDSQNLISGTLNIGGSNTPGTYMLPELIGEFKKRYPAIKVNLHIENTSEISMMISNGTLDLAINGGNCPYGDNIHVERIFNDQLIIVASPFSLAATKRNLSLSDLKELDFLVHKTDSQLFSYYDNFCNEMGIEENISMYLGNIEAIKRAVISNLGVSLIPLEAVKYELRFEMLTQLPILGYTDDYPYSLIYNNKKSMTATTRKFYEFLEEHFLSSAES